MLEQPNLVTIDGQTLKYEGLTGEIQSAFEKYMHYHALQLLKDSREALGHEYHEFIVRHLNQVKAGLLTIDSESGLAFLQSNEHLAELLWYCLSKHQTISKEAVLKWMKDSPEDATRMVEDLFNSKKKDESDVKTESSSCSG